MARRTARAETILAELGYESENEMSFDPNDHLIDMRGKKYLPVNMRLVWFRPTVFRAASGFVR